MSSIRVAVASSDGVEIDQRLRDASSFYIYEVEPENVCFVEHRVGAAARAVAGDVEPGGSRANGILDSIADCSMLLVRDAECRCAGKLRFGWVTVYEAPMPVIKALARLNRSLFFRREVGWPAEGRIYSA